jgi:hypothetical protein
MEIKVSVPWKTSYGEASWFGDDDSIKEIKLVK